MDNTINIMNIRNSDDTTILLIAFIMVFDWVFPSAEAYTSEGACRLGDAEHASQNSEMPSCCIPQIAQILFSSILTSFPSRLQGKILFFGPKCIGGQFL